MPRQDLIQIRRGTRAAFNALTSGNKLEAGELGAATDTMELLVGLGPTTDPFVVGSGGGGGDYFTRYDTGIDPSSSNAQSYSYIGADQFAGTRGRWAIDIQSRRTLATHIVTASSSIAIGMDNICGSGVVNELAACAAIGVANNVSSPGFAVGNTNTINEPNDGGYSYVAGYSNNLTDNSALVFGRQITSSGGLYATLIGSNITRTATPQQNDGDFIAGNNITATGDYIFAVGGGLTLTGSYSFVAGWSCSNSGTGSFVTGIFNGNTGTGILVGSSLTNSGTNAVLFGSGFENHIDNTLTIQHGTARIRGYSNTGQLALSMQNRATAYTNTAAAEGSEPENTLRPGMFAIRRNGMQFIIDINDAGTIRSLVLGTAT